MTFSPELLTQAAQKPGFFENLWNLLVKLSSGMGTTLAIFALTLAVSLPLGLIVYFGRKCRFAPISILTKVYISVMRGTPLMLQILVVYFGPTFIFNVKISPSYRFPAVIIAFIINYAAYFAEIFRGGIESMEVGQYEAADVLGFSKTQTFMKIILPQVIKRVLPSITNETITLVKDTSLAYSIAVLEMFTLAKQFATTTASMMPYLAAAIFYYGFNYLIAFVMERIEKKLNYYTV